MLKTIITTLQGVSAIYSLIGSLVGFSGVTLGLLGVDAVFFPLAILGLLRLCAAPWLIEDFAYQSLENKDAHHAGPGSVEIQLVTPEARNLYHPETIGLFLERPIEMSTAFNPPNTSWPSRMFRLFFLLLVGGVWGICIATLKPPKRHSVTTFFVGLFYAVFLTISLVVYAYYFLRGKTTSTIIPCISHAWYKIYTIFIFFLMFVMVVIACIETNRAPNGQYMSSPLALFDGFCVKDRDWYALAPRSGVFSGIVSRDSSVERLFDNIDIGAGEEVSRVDGALDEKYWIHNFTGYCVGEFGLGRLG